jgi:hypothetical protein
MDCVTADLGSKLRTFQKETCAAFPTHELKRERDARIRRAHKSKAPSSGAPPRASVPCSSGPSSSAAITSSSPPQFAADSPPSTRQPAKTTLNHNNMSKPTALDTTRHKKTLNLNTYKLHALGDYTTTIRKYGTTDSYSTEVVRIACRRPTDHSFLLHQSELEHRTAKSRYSRTSRKAYTKQLAAIERRQTHLRRMREKLAKAGNLASESVPDSMDVSYHIGKSQNYPVAITQFLHKHGGDPAVKVPTCSQMIAAVLTLIRTLFPNSRNIFCRVSRRY